MKTVADILFYIMLSSFIFCFILLIVGSLEWAVFISITCIVSAILGITLAWIDDMNNKNKE